MTAFRHENQLLQICLNMCMKFCTHMNMVICVANNDFKAKLIILSINITKYSFRWNIILNMTAFRHENQLLQICLNICTKICTIWTWSFAWQITTVKAKLIFLSINIAKYSFRWNIILNMTAFRHENQLLQICLNMCLKFCTIWTWSFAWQITTSRLN